MIYMKFPNLPSTDQNAHKLRSQIFFPVKISSQLQTPLFKARGLILNRVSLSDLSRSLPLSRAKVRASISLRLWSLWSLRIRLICVALSFGWIFDLAFLWFCICAWIFWFRSRLVSKKTAGKVGNFENCQAVCFICFYVVKKWNIVVSEWWICGDFNECWFWMEWSGFLLFGRYELCMNHEDQSEFLVINWIRSFWQRINVKNPLFI